MSGGEKWFGGHELLCHLGSESSSGGPLSKAVDSAIDSERMESVDARDGGSCLSCDSVRERRSTD